MHDFTPLAPDGSDGMRRSDLSMDDEAARAVLEHGYSGRLGTVGPDGWPYVVPLLYTCRGNLIHLHGSRAPGRLRLNLAHESRVCFVVDEPGEVYAYGRFECDSSISYRSVMAFGQVRIVEEAHEAASFCDALMAKYAPQENGRPRGFYPRLGQITVYALQIERLTGKQIRLPAISQQWPSIDRTMTPNTHAP